MIGHTQTYIKQGRRYIPVGYFTGFPSDGVWLVESDRTSQRLVYPTEITVTALGPLPDPTPLIQAELLRDAIIRGLDKNYEAYMEARDKAVKTGANRFVSDSLNTIADRIVVEIIRRHTQVEERKA